MSGRDLVAAFWRPLHAKLKRSGVRQTDLCRQLKMSPSAFSEMVTGQRAKAPDWRVVETIVTAIGGPLDYWGRRLEELEDELARATVAVPGPADQREPVADPVGCPVCGDAYEDERFEEYDWVPDDDWEPGWLFAAARVLAGDDADLRNEVQTLVEGFLGSPEELSAFRDQFRDIAKKLLSGLGARVRRACHPHRVRLLHAAHTVLVIEGGMLGPILDVHTWQPDQPIELGSLFESSFGDGVFAAAPLPVANVPYADHHARVVDHYARVEAELFVEPRAAMEAARKSAALYEARLAELAAECPELFVWASMQDGPDAEQAAHACPEGPNRDRLETLYRELHRQNHGLDGLETLLRALARDITPGKWPARLSAVYHKELNRPISPIAEPDRGQSEPRIPRLGQGYINPAFRTAVHTADSKPHVDAWWSTRPLRQEIQGFLAGHLSAFPTINQPLVILGDPGAGKSLLTRLLAARLPPTDYLPIRIELRQVAADAEILDQIAQALRQATQKEVTWETVTEAAPGVLPVLIFDGFDELLQAGGTHHYYYLEEIARFQRRSSDNGLPVAAVVTSRTVVADLTKFPKGTVIIRLEPFDDSRIARWTDVWNKTNARGGPSLRPDVGTLHPELAPQPLLLLMLALYYSIAHDASPVGAAPLSRVDLYERLLGLFVRRQVRKLEPKLRPGELDERVEGELDLLSVIACAMFNRGRQGVSAEEADHDLGFLRAPDSRATQREARLLFGRFFFIHEAKATYEDGADRRWYEFLHATFGEYLVARKIARTLPRSGDGGAYDGLLFALLSFAPLTDRAQVIDNLSTLLHSTAQARSFFPRALHALPAGSDTGYTTGPVPLTYRHACHSANLLLLILAPGHSVKFSELAVNSADPTDDWRTHATLWKSQFTAGAWDAFTRAVGTVPDLRDGQKDVTLRLWHQGTPPTAPNMTWLHAAREDEAIGDLTSHDALRRSRSLYDKDTELILEPALPVFEELGELPGFFVSDQRGRHVSAAHALVALLLASREPQGELLHRYDTCLKMLDLPGTLSGMVRFVDLISNRLVGDCDSLPAAFVLGTARSLAKHARGLDGLKDAARISLLVCACRLLGRTDQEDLRELLGELLELDPYDVVVDRFDRTDLMLGALLQRLQTAPPGEGRSRALVWLLKLAIALDLRAWCDRYGRWLLAQLGPGARDRLLSSELDYLSPFPVGDRGQQLRTEDEERHP